MENDKVIIEQVEIEKITEKTPEKPTFIQHHRRKEIWAIGGGKGGVGKTLISANLGVSLAKQGYRVLLVDLDFGSANLHTCLGIGFANRTLSDFLDGKYKKIGRVILPTGINNLWVINGAMDSLTVSNLGFAQKYRLLQRLRKLHFDYILFDLGAGTNFNTIDFFLAADKMIISIAPEPTSVENAYRFVKSAFFRKLSGMARELNASESVSQAMKNLGNNPLKSPITLIEEIQKIDTVNGEILASIFKEFCPKLIVNMARTQSDLDIGFGIRSIFRKYWGIDIDYLGALEYDNYVWQSVRKKRPLMVEFPNSPLGINLDRMAKLLVQLKSGSTK